MHKVLQYSNWTDNQVIQLGRNHFENRKIGKNASKSNAESGSSFIGILQERKGDTNIKVHGILLKNDQFLV